MSGGFGGRQKRQVRPFANEQQIEAGYFFVLKGILLYVAEVGEREMVDGKRNARLRCIFENGTESDMLLRSLSAELYKNGRRVTEHGDRLLAGFDNITAEDQESGYIYVLRSPSQKSEIQSIQEPLQNWFLPCACGRADQKRNGRTNIFNGSG